MERLIARRCPVKVKRGLNEVVAEKPGAARDQKLLACHAAEFILQVATDVVEVLGEEFFKGGNARSSHQSLRCSSGISFDLERRAQAALCECKRLRRSPPEHWIRCPADGRSPRMYRG